MLQLSNHEEFGFIIGPLKRSQPDKLANRLFCLLGCVGIHCSDVETISVDTKYGFARVQLFSRAVEDYALKAFKEKRAVMGLFDLRLLTQKPQHLRVERIASKRHIARVTALLSRSPTGEAYINRDGPASHALGSALLRSPDNSQSIGLAATAHGLQLNRPVDIDFEDKSEYMHGAVSLSQTSSTPSTPVGFEELVEEEDLEDYSERYVLPEKPKRKSRSIQTSEESSSSCGADYSSHRDLHDASTATSRSSEGIRETPSIGASPNSDNLQQSRFLIKRHESAESSSPRLVPGRLDALGNTRPSPGNYEDFVQLNDSVDLSAKKSEIAQTKALQSNTAVAEMEKSEDPSSTSVLSAQKLVPSDRSLKVDSKGHIIAGKRAASESSQGDQGRVQMVSEKTSTHEVGPCFCRGTTFYHRGERINVPHGKNFLFDSGRTMLNAIKTFRCMLGRHFCAFLNSGGGTLYYGVDESDGSVIGLEISHKFEDALRLDIDSQVKLITPMVPTSAYKVNFAKVMFETGHLMSDERVIEIDIMAPGVTRSVICPKWVGEKQPEEENREEEASTSRPPDDYRLKGVHYIWRDRRIGTWN